jgi:hypothetical protein
MKRFLLSLLLLSSYFSALATDYYSETGQSNPNDLNSWNTMQNGTGAAPGSFINTADRFIIQDGHTMMTTGDWSVSNIVIENGGILQGDHVIPLSGIFQIDDGGTYIHNNAGSVSQAASMSIFSGTESFAAASNFEIRNWNSSAEGGVPLPNSPVISWGNLTTMIDADIGEVWNWGIEDGATLTIAGNLELKRSQTAMGSHPIEMRMTGSGVQTINVGGDFLVSNVRVCMKKTEVSPLDGYTTMQVNGNILVEVLAILDLGINTTYPTPVGLYELRVKGNFTFGFKGATITSTSQAPYLVANGTAVQTLKDSPFSGNFDCNFRIAPGSTLSLNASGFHQRLNGVFAILGVFNQNGWGLDCGNVEVVGGTLNSNGFNPNGLPLSRRMSNCTVCTGNGSFDYVNNTWCFTTGTKGVANFSSNTVTLNSDPAPSFLNAGHPSINSPGDIYFTNSTADITNPALNNGYTVNPGSVFSLDETSYIEGTNAGFNGNGGTLRIGSIDGITATGNTTMGNIRVGGNKNYDNAGINSFEYFGTNPQFTGDGLPSTIDGTLKINNSSTAGTGLNVTLSQQTTITGSVDFTQGKLLTFLNLLTIADNATANGSPDSYVMGPLRKIGDEDFTFPVGRTNIYSPIGMTGVSGSDPSDIFTAEYFRSNPQTDISNAYSPGSNIDHISNVEYWSLVRDNGAAVKKVSLTVNEESFWQNMSRVFVSRYNSTAWTNEGTEITEGPVTMPGGYQTGTIRSANALSEFGYFTLATDVPAVTYNIFTQQIVSSNLGNDNGRAIELGVKFRVTQAGFITGVRFYKKAGNIGTHIGHLWSNTGSKLAEATFTGETASGWQQVLFTTPVAVTPGVTYVASYFSSLGYYNVSRPYFTSAVVNGPVRALANGEEGSNGVFRFSPTPAFPASGNQASNFWVDVIFTTSAPPDNTFNIFPNATPATNLGNDGQSIEVGVKFLVTQPGYITGVRFYKKPGNTGTHTGHLWSNTGTMLAEAIFTGETASGWQQVLFSSPVAVNTGTTYVASYFSSAGYYNVTRPYFTSAVVNGPLRALANGEDGSNGVFRFSPTPAFPASGNQASNFWVDVVFTTAFSRLMAPELTLRPTDEKTSGLTVKVTPNPSENFFKLIVMSDDEKTPIRVRISDISGRVLEQYEKVASGSLLQVGGSLRGGAYFAEVIQGDKQKVVKIIKVN